MGRLSASSFNVYLSIKLLGTSTSIIGAAADSYGRTDVGNGVGRSVCKLLGCRNFLFCDSLLPTTFPPPSPSRC